MGIAERETSKTERVLEQRRICLSAEHGRDGILIKGIDMANVWGCLVGMRGYIRYSIRRFSSVASEGSTCGPVSDSCSRVTVGVCGARRIERL